VFALSSEFDNSPNALLEAMACGLRVVATDVGGVREHVDAVRGSELVPAGDVVGFAAALVRALANLEAARRDGEHNRKFADERFSWRASALRLLEIYRDVLAARSQPLASATVSA
jgi:glycosyltransferase involved in cell wall biosynthesis